MHTKGIIINGSFGNMLLRQHSKTDLEIGELLVAVKDTTKIICTVTDLLYGSQISSLNKELISGMHLEEGIQGQFFDEHLRNYILARLKNLLVIEGNTPRAAKTLPPVFTDVRAIQKDDLTFLTKPEKALPIGNLRSGSKVLDIPIYLQGEDTFSHHILVPATTGRGKSNLTSCVLWNVTGEDYCGMLVLDPHDEYYGRTRLGLKDHPSKKVDYYTPQEIPPGGKTLRFNIKLLKPQHFQGAVNWTDAQHEALTAYYKQFGKTWIQSILRGEQVKGSFHDATVGVITRRMHSLLDIEHTNNTFQCNGAFCFEGGESTLTDITTSLENAKTVIIDTSTFGGAQEILIGSLIATETFSKYRYFKRTGELKHKPVISIVLEEAPRVLGKEVIERGSNIFSTLAREGRKFKVGLYAITQLPSLIPRQILANMNTKIILGIEMGPERTAIIESAAQDLSESSQAIAALDKGEAILTSTFSRFAMPIKIPLFSSIAKKEETVKPRFTGMM